MKQASRLTTMQVLWAAAAAALALGLGLTVQSARTTPDYMRWISRKSEDMEQLDRMKHALRADRRAIAAFEALDNQQPVALSELIREMFPGVTADVRRRETRPAAEGWTLHRMEVELDEAPLQQLGQFLYRAEASRPPWRLVECHLLASDRSPGHARATLILEALEKR